MQPAQLDDAECQVLRERIRLNLAEFLDFGCICYQQIQALAKAAEPMFRAIDSYNSADWRGNWDSLLEELLYVAMIKTAIKSKHQRYLAYDQQLLGQLRQFAPLFTQMNELAQNMAKYEVVYQLEVGDADITGFVDFYLKSPEESVIFELKVVSETSFDHLLQVIIYDYLLNQK